MTTQTYIGTLVVMDCGKCGITFGMAEDKYNRCKEKGEEWYCPNGHCRVFTESDVAKARKERDRARKDAAYWRDRTLDEQRAAQDARNRERAQKAAKTRLKNRIANGVCPCCKRHFANVQRHIEGQHPDFVSPDRTVGDES